MTGERKTGWARVRRALSIAPWVIRLPLAYSAAVDDVLGGDFLAGQRRLLKLMAAVPEDLLDRVPVKLLLARTLLETGDPHSAAALFPQAFRPTQRSRHILNGAECSFLKFMGNEIYKRANEQVGRPSSFDIGVCFDEVDVTTVSDRLRRAFPYAKHNHGGPGAGYH